MSTGSGEASGKPATYRPFHFTRNRNFLQRSSSNDMIIPRSFLIAGHSYSLDRDRIAVLHCRGKEGNVEQGYENPAVFSCLYVLTAWV